MTSLYSILKYFPKNALSATVGELTRVRFPRKIGTSMISAFAHYFEINVDEAEKELSQYQTINELFTRRLKLGARPIGSGLVHPCDGTITEAGPTTSGKLLQAKGRDYSIGQLLRDESWAQELVGGVYLTYYLCPKDYHRVHSPLDGEVVSLTHIPGKLWPVNGWSTSNVLDLFAVNERLIFKLQHSRGNVAVVMVGATNVGRMTVAFDKSVVTNRGSDAMRSLLPVPHRSPAVLKTRRYNPPHRVSRGDELGVFNMGSTVILLFPPGFLGENQPLPSGPTQVGKTWCEL